MSSSIGTAQDRELIEQEIARTIHDALDLSDGLKLDMATEGEFGRVAIAVYDAVVQSRIAEVGRLEEALKDVLVHLAAAISLLEHSPKKGAPSDKMFDQMLIDYRASRERGRAALSLQRRV